MILTHALPQAGKLRIFQKLVQPFVSHHHNARAFGIASVSRGQSLEFSESVRADACAILNCNEHASLRVLEFLEPAPKCGEFLNRPVRQLV